MPSHIFSDVVWKLHATWSHSFSTCALLTMKPFQNTFLWSLTPEETNKRPTVTSSMSQVIALQLVILILSSMIQERLCLPHAGHSLFQSAPADPQVTAEHSVPRAGDFGKVYLGKGKILLGIEGWGTTWEKQPWRQQGPWKRRGGAPGAGWQGLPTLGEDHSDAVKLSGGPNLDPFEFPQDSAMMVTW